jgi:hypothetical protein
VPRKAEREDAVARRDGWRFENVPEDFGGRGVAVQEEERGKAGCEGRVGDTEEAVGGGEGEA